MYQFRWGFKFHCPFSRDSVTTWGENISPNWIAMSTVHWKSITVLVTRCWCRNLHFPRFNTYDKLLYNMKNAKSMQGTVHCCFIPVFTFGRRDAQGLCPILSLILTQNIKHDQSWCNLISKLGLRRGPFWICWYFVLTGWLCWFWWLIEILMKYIKKYIFQFLNNSIWFLEVKTCFTMIILITSKVFGFGIFLVLFWKYASYGNLSH